MKKNIFFIFLILSSFSAYSQTYVVTYARKTLNNKDKKLPRSVKKNPRQIKEYLKARERIRVYQLKQANAKSIYTEAYSTLDGVKDEGLEYFGTNVVVYKDFGKGFFLMTGKLVGPNQAVKEFYADFFHWAIFPNSDSIISGFHCQKASTIFRNHVVVAWFTKQIPIMDGPSFYAGLPGLILTVQSGDSVIELMDIQLVKKAKDAIVLPNEKKYISFKQYLKDRFKYFD